jgi:hypothetical protein
MGATMPALFSPKPPLRFDRPPLAEAKFLNAMAVVAVGMFVGTWVIGPTISHDVTNHEALHSAAQERAMINAGMARSDPSPYRTPTPALEAPAVTHYGKLAKEKALAALGRRRPNERAAAADRPSLDEIPWPDREPPQQVRRAPRYYRHTGVVH